MNAFDFCAAVRFVELQTYGIELAATLGEFEPHRAFGFKGLENDVFVNADHTVTRAAHAHIGNGGCGTVDDAFICCLHMCMGAKHGLCPATGVIAEGDFFAGGLGMKVNQQNVAGGCHGLI